MDGALHLPAPRPSPAPAAAAQCRHFVRDPLLLPARGRPPTGRPVPSGGRALQQPLPEPRWKRLVALISEFKRARASFKPQICRMELPVFLLPLPLDIRAGFQPLPVMSGSVLSSFNSQIPGLVTQVASSNTYTVSSPEVSGFPESKP
jgi:hypothetical protein